MPRIEQVDKNVKRRVGKLLAGLTDEEQGALGLGSVRSWKPKLIQNRFRAVSVL